MLWWLLAGALILVGLAGTVVPGLPGIPLLLAGMILAAWIDHFARVGAATLIVLGLLTLLSIVIDIAAASLAARRAGASPEAVRGAALGALLGIFFGLPGLLLGPFIGAAAGELGATGHSGRALRAGTASLLGFVAGMLARLAIAFAMLVIFAQALLA